MSRLLLALALALLIPPPTSSSPIDLRQQCGAPSTGDGETATCAPSSGPGPGDGSTADPPPAAPPRLPDDFVDPCRDTGDTEGCPKWAAEGECEANPPYMLVSCAKSCGTCRPVGGGGPVALSAPCRDELPECAGWADVGECSVNPTYMHVKCQYSCWECVDAQMDRDAGVSEDIIARKLLYSKMNTGKHQLIREVSNGMSDSEGNHPDGIQPDRESVLRTVREMDKYAKYIITSGSADDKARERCRNEFRMCAEWAAGGACPKGDGVATGGLGRSDALFMMNHCPLACGACSELVSFHRCIGRRRSGERPLFQSGAEVISYLEDKRINPGDWDQYGPVFASHPNAEEGRGDDPHVVVFDRFLSEEEVDALIALASDIGGGSDRGDGAWCHGDLRCDLEPTYQRVMERISALTNTTTSHLESMKIGRLGVGVLPQHNFRADGLWKPSGPRVLSLFIFLSGREVEGDGSAGELGFPFLDWLMIRPRRGVAVLHTNVRGDDIFRRELLTSFEQLPPRGGSEPFFGASIHLRLYNYTDAMIRGCA